jgi:hypothetical protein
MFSLMFRPHLQAPYMRVKLSSVIKISAADLHLYLEDFIIAKLTLAFFITGKSLVPSAVTATLWPIYWRPITINRLTLGVARNMTFNLYILYSKAGKLTTSSSSLSLMNKPPISW